MEQHYFHHLGDQQEWSVSALPGRFELVACTVSTRTPVPPVAMYTHISPQGRNCALFQTETFECVVRFLFSNQGSRISFLLNSFLSCCLFQRRNCVRETSCYGWLPSGKLQELALDALSDSESDVTCGVLHMVLTSAFV